MTIFRIKPDKPSLTDLLIDSLWRIETREPMLAPAYVRAAPARRRDEVARAQLGSSSVSQ